MSTSVRRTITVRKPADKVIAVATDPRVLLPIVGGLGRFQELATDAEGLGEWDVFIDIGSIHVGGRVVVDRPGPRRLSWRSIRGTHHQLELEVYEHGDESEVAITMSIQLAGFLFGQVAEFLARGIVARHVDAGLQQLRHHIEFEA